MATRIYTFTFYGIGTLDFEGYPDLTKTISFDGLGDKECRFLNTSSGVGVIIDGVIAWAIGLRKGISIDKSLCFYKEKDNYFIGFAE